MQDLAKKSGQEKIHSSACLDRCCNKVCSPATAIGVGFAKVCLSYGNTLVCVAWHVLPQIITLVGLCRYAYLQWYRLD